MGVSSDDLHSLLYIDLLPHDICIESEEGFEVVIPKGSAIPTRKTIEIPLDIEEGEEGDRKRPENLTITLYRKKDDEYMVRIVNEDSQWG